MNVGDELFVKNNMFSGRRGEMRNRDWEGN